MNDMGKLMQEMSETGILVDTAGLRQTSESRRLRPSDSRITQTDVPFTQPREVIGGYAILEVPSMAEALAVTRKFLEVHGDDWNIECELRQMERHPGGEGG